MSFMYLWGGGLLCSDIALDPLGHQKSGEWVMWFSTITICGICRFDFFLFAIKQNKWRTVVMHLTSLTPGQLMS